ncbi:hypothetical protein BaRGS_00007170 [Batillaria attramentaria]|uniref:Death domain-containing protein n=1 Tax=Batillaria attramentaria TaxID=370345 RepID=A0ABD0LPY4_9CAEN
MDQKIGAADFMHTGSDDFPNEFIEELEHWVRDNSDECTKSQALDALKAIQRKLCRADYPSEDTTGYWMGHHALKKVLSLIEDVIDNDKAKPSDFQSACLEFVLKLINVGPGSSHIQFISLILEDGGVEFKDYFQSLRGSDLTRVISALKKEYPKSEPGMNSETYLNRLDTFCRVILDSFSEEQFHDAHREFLDLYVYLSTAFIYSEEEYRKQMHRFASTIELSLDRNPFMGLQDAVLLKHHLATVSKIILTPDFPQSKDVGDEIRSVLSDMLKTISEEELLADTYEDIMDLALNITVQKAGCEGTRPHFETIGYFFYHVKETGVQNNGSLFDGLVQKFIYFLDNIKDESYLMLRFARAVADDCLGKAMGVSDDQVAQWIMMIKALLKHSIPLCVEAAYWAMRDKDRLLKWKKYPEEVGQIFEVLSKVSYPDWLTEKEMEEGIKQLEQLVEHFLDEIKNLAKELTEPMIHFALHCLEMRTEAWCRVGVAAARHISFNPKKDKHLFMEIVQRLTVALADKTYCWDDDDAWHLPMLAEELISKPLDSVKDGKTFDWEEYNALISLAKLCEERLDFSDHDSAKSVHFKIYRTISYNVVEWLQTMNETKRITPLVPGILDMLDSDVEDFQQVGATLMGPLSQTSDIMAPHMERLICRFLESEQENILWGITNCYENNPGPMEKYFDEVFKHVDSGNSSIHSYMLQLTGKVAKYQPDLFTADKVAILFKEAKEDTMFQVTILMALEEIAKRRTEKIAPHVDELMSPGTWQANSMYFVCRILQYYVLQSGERADEVISFLLGLAESSTEKAATYAALNAVRLIGYRYRPAIEKHRKTIEKLRDETKDEDHAVCVSIIDMLDGKSVEKVAEEMKALQEDVADLQIRVVATEGEISEVKDTVQRQGDDLDNVKNEVTEHGQRLDQVEETVEETVVKVEEIDGKTLNHAPFWSRDVSKLLNPEAQHDWRLLSSRLGYSNDDIRGWAQQADPCMAMLNEWYATHKTREATHAVLAALQDMSREDAAIIVENAMKNAEAVVEDEEYDYATPPDIFISYQWSHQNEVRLLRQHLEMAGYSCWMDVGQMGGGDKLFEKIDSGIRAAKVVISCVTEKYAKSPNCNREVNLSVGLGKPIIPLLMEKTTWPPPGSMGPIFSEYLFIRFFQRGGEETTDQRYWPPDKFQELLMQLSMNSVTPDQDAVQPEYKDWWIPKVEEVIVDKNRAKGQSTVTSTATADEKVATSPDIFISYQWGRQPQIVRLFQKLTSLGYTCWLDIMQMGGGDSLYDKIDRGLRGCRVVVSCVTPKYALSANCRREVSLADALHKPLIPILLEQMTWPPAGPMGPILTQLLYINCTSLQDEWDGPKFDELINMINQHVPVSAGETSAVEEPNKTAEAMPADQPADGTGVGSPSSTNTKDDNPSDTPLHTAKTGAGDHGDIQPADQGPKSAESKRESTASPERKDQNGAESPHGRRRRDRSASIASSMQSDNYHDLGDSAIQFNKQSRAVKSECCSVM